jgi:hypothetical protein
LNVGPGVAVGAVQVDHGPGEFRRGSDELAEPGLGQLGRAEQRVAQGLGQVAQQPRLIIVQKRLQIDLEDMAEGDQQRRGYGPLFVLDQIEIARRYLQPRRQRFLAQSSLAPQAPHRRSEHRLPGHGRPSWGCPDVYRLYYIVPRSVGQLRSKILLT